MGKYIYRPYHPWRHGRRRERIHNIVMFCLKLALTAELLILAGQYLEEHTLNQVYQREVQSPYEDGEELYGIGVDVWAGELFWFHRERKNDPDVKD